MKDRIDLLLAVRQAIADGRAFLDTEWGQRQVTAYRDDTAVAVTTNGRAYRHHYYVALEAIKIS